MKNTIFPLLFLLIFGCNNTKFFDSDASGFQADVFDASTITIGRDRDVGNSFADFSNGAQNAKVWTPETGDFIFTDAQTGSLWNVRGEAFSGALKKDSDSHRFPRLTRSGSLGPSFMMAAKYGIKA